jgi:dTDP-4-dehydrorhamnose reductase
MTGRSTTHPILLIVGAGGQVGREFPRVLGATPFVLSLLDRRALDIRKQGAVFAALEQIRPAAVVNAAAYTAVDRAESDEAACFAVNRDGACNLALACAASDIPLIHISTDYVFDGRKLGAYAENDPIAPLGIYGRSKAEGEMAVRATHPRHVILRTAWIFGVHGNNFVKTMLRLGAERDVIRVVADQRGCPTAAGDVAAAILHVARRLLLEGTGCYGTFHFTGRGATTWFGFADAVFELAARFGRPRPKLVPIPTSGYPTPARRPPNSVLDCAAFTTTFGLPQPPWRDSLQAVVGELASMHEAVRARS